MSQLVHSHEGKRSHPLKRKEEFNVIIQDFVIDYNHPEVNPKSVQKRKLQNDDWAPYPSPRRIKTQHNDVLDNSGYLSDGLDDSQIVPNWEDSQIVPSWEDNTQDSNDSMFCDVSDSKPAKIHIVTIDEVIEFDNSKSPTGHDFDGGAISFDMEELCEIVGTDKENGNDLTIDKQGTALNMLLAFTNSPRLVLYEENSPTLKGIKEMEPLGDLYDSNEFSQPEVTNELENDCQIEEFKFARCFKCRRKVGVATPSFNYLWGKRN